MEAMDNSSAITIKLRSIMNHSTVRNPQLIIDDSINSFIGSKLLDNETMILIEFLFFFSLSSLQVEKIYRHLEVSTVTRWTVSAMPRKRKVLCLVSKRNSASSAEIVHPVTTTMPSPARDVKVRCYPTTPIQAGSPRPSSPCPSYPAKLENIAPISINIRRKQPRNQQINQSRKKPTHIRKRFRWNCWKSSRFPTPLLKESLD